MTWITYININTAAVYIPTDVCSTQISLLWQTAVLNKISTLFYASMQYPIVTELAT